MIGEGDGGEIDGMKIGTGNRSNRRKPAPAPLYPQLLLFLFIYLVCETIGTAATTGLLCQPRVIAKMIVENQMECRLAGETEVLKENLPQRHFCPS
jgi:hypothetical protein